MGISINTARAHKVRQLGDVIVIFTWINDERAMVLLPAHRKDSPWFVVMDSAAYQYLSPGHAARMSIKAAEVLGMHGQEHRLASILLDHLDDLVRMPGSPPQALSRATFGQVSVRADGREIGGQELRLPVNQGVSYGA